MRFAGILVLLLGVIFSLYSTKTLLSVITSLSWPSVTGIVTHSSIDKKIYTEHDDNRSSYSKSTYLHREAYAPVISYEYIINGKIFSNTNLDFSGVYTADIVQVERKLNQYPVGSSVSVYYHPKEPEVSVLERNIKKDSIILFVVGIILLTIGIIMVFAKEDFSLRHIF